MEEQRTDKRQSVANSEDEAVTTTLRSEVGTKEGDTLPHDQPHTKEAPPQPQQTPQDFYHQVSNRADMSEILKRLAK